MAGAGGGGIDRTERSNSGWKRLSLEAVRAASATHLVDRQTSEEVAQDALLSFLRLPEIPASPIAWLRVAIRRLIWRRIGRSRLERQALARFMAATRPVDGLAIEDRITLNEIHDHLPERASRILALVRLGHTHQEIATLLGCQLHQVGPRISRALAVARRRSRPRARPVPSRTP